MICLQGAPLGLMWFERALMKYLPFLIDVEDTAPFLAAPQLERDNVAYQALVHTTVLTAPDEGTIDALTQLYGLNLTECSQVIATPQNGDSAAASQKWFACLEQARMAEPLPACRIRFF